MHIKASAEYWLPSQENRNLSTTMIQRYLYIVENSLVLPITKIRVLVSNKRTSAGVNTGDLFIMHIYMFPQWRRPSSKHTFSYLRVKVYIRFMHKLARKYRVRPRAKYEIDAKLVWYKRRRWRRRRRSSYTVIAFGWR